MIEKYDSFDDKSLNAELERRLGGMPAPDPSLAQEARDYIDDLTKPRGSLGRLEDVAARLYVLAGGRRPLETDPSILFTIAADHGVTDEGVSPAGQEITRQMLENFLAGGAGVNAICKSSNMGFLAVDAGVKGPNFPPHGSLIRAKIAQGTKNIARGPAMTRREALLSLLLGFDLADLARAGGCKSLGAGEMGIGNTTPSSALYSVWLNLPPAETVGAGAGLDAKRIGHKISVVERALEANNSAAASGDPVQILAALGGIEIGVMAGIMLGAARAGLPMLVDGFIATAAFIAAWKICPDVQEACFFAHVSAEKAHAEVLRRLGKKPLLDLDMRLGEGVGAALGLCVLRAAASMFNNMASFSVAGVTKSR